MRYVEEFRDAELVQKLVRKIAKISTRPWRIMEICGGQTHAIVKYGLDRLLPKGVEFLHGPGCPVCVTPLEIIDKAIEISLLPEVLFCSYGDMLRVPGTTGDLMQAKARGAQIRVVYSPLDAVELARRNPTKHIVFFAVGFETTAPAHAFSVHLAKQEGLKNFSILTSHVLVPPALSALLAENTSAIQGLLAAGHVCTIMGLQEYHGLAQRYQIPIVATGFEPVDILQGVLFCIQQLEAGTYQVVNPYSRAVEAEGNRIARDLINRVFTIVDKNWRGLGRIPKSSLALQSEYREFDAEYRFGQINELSHESPECISGLVLQGIKKPAECPSFGHRCNPDHPLGATMVSHEGACSAYYMYRG